MNARLFLYAFFLIIFFACETKPKEIKTSEDIENQVSSITSQIGLDKGRWISMDDANAGVEIKNGKFIMFYKRKDHNTVNAYDYELSEKDGIEYLTLTNKAGEKMIYGLLEYSDEAMVLSYLDRGSTLTYKKQKN